MQITVESVLQRDIVHAQRLSICLDFLPLKSARLYVHNAYGNNNDERDIIITSIFSRTCTRNIYSFAKIKRNTFSRVHVLISFNSFKQERDGCGFAI